MQVAGDSNLGLHGSPVVAFFAVVFSGIADAGVVSAGLAGDDGSFDDLHSEVAAHAHNRGLQIWVIIEAPSVTGIDEENGLSFVLLGFFCLIHKRSGSFSKQAKQGQGVSGEDCFFAPWRAGLAGPSADIACHGGEAGRGCVLCVHGQ
jgi:hypothetical protein